MSDFDPATWSTLRKGLTFGLIGLSVVVYIGSLFGAKDPDAPTFPAMLGGILFVYLGGVFLARGNGGNNAFDDFPFAESDRQIAKLQNQLRRAAEALAMAEQQGSRDRIVVFRGRVAELESQLRRLGA